MRDSPSNGLCAGRSLAVEAEQVGFVALRHVDVADLAAHELQRTIVDAAASFSGGELEDDLTLVVVCVDQSPIGNELAVVV